MAELKRIEMTAPGSVGSARVAEDRVADYKARGWRVEKANKPAQGKKADEKANKPAQGKKADEKANKPAQGKN